MKFISDKIYIGEQVVVFKDNVPCAIATICGGNKSSLDVLFDEGGGQVLEFEHVRKNRAYINSEQKMCLYFVGEPPYSFEETEESS